jgi:hypothetical protein
MPTNERARMATHKDEREEGGVPTVTEVCNVNSRLDMGKHKPGGPILLYNPKVVPYLTQTVKYE